MSYIGDYIAGSMTVVTKGDTRSSDCNSKDSAYVHEDPNYEQPRCLDRPFPKT